MGLVAEKPAVRKWCASPAGAAGRAERKGSARGWVPLLQHRLLRQWGENCVVFCLANGWWQTDPMPSVLCVATRSSDVPICFNYVVTRQRMGTSHLLQRPFQRSIGHGCFVLLQHNPRWRCTELSFHIMDHLVQPSPTSEDAQPQPRAVLC